MDVQNPISEILLRKKTLDLVPFFQYFLDNSREFENLGINFLPTCFFLENFENEKNRRMILK